MKNKLFIAFLTFMVITFYGFIPVQAQEESGDFNDVGKDYWAYKEINYMRDAGILNGYSDSAFRPSDLVSRAHVASLFARSLDLSPVREGKQFTDVPKTHPYYDDIQKVYRAGIFDGKPDNSFGISDHLTRAHMAKVLQIAFDLKPYTGYIFADVGESNWAKDHIASLYMNGITIGDNGYFKSSGYVRRANFAVFMYRALKPEEVLKPTNVLEPEPIVPDFIQVKNITSPPNYSRSKMRNDFWDMVAKKKLYGNLAGRTYRDSFAESVEKQSKIFGITYEQYVLILDEVIKKGNIYDGKTFLVFYDFRDHLVMTGGYQQAFQW